MADTIVFYEKPGCGGNTRQKDLLTQKGYKLEVLSIFEVDWTPESLTRFFGDQDLSSCINMRAPRITKGEFNPGDYNGDELVAEMIKDPYLIKRPLINWKGEFCCGFETPLVEKILGEVPPEQKCLVEEEKRGKECLSQ